MVLPRTVLHQLRRYREALDSHDRALGSIRPCRSIQWPSALRALERTAEALSYGQAIAINPNFAEAFYNRGSMLRGLDRAAGVENHKALAISEFRRSAQWPGRGPDPAARL